MVFKCVRLAFFTVVSASFLVGQQISNSPFPAQAQESFDPNTEDIKKFEQPRIRGKRLDRCFTWETNCERPAARAFCQENGYSNVVNYAIDSRPNITLCIGDGALCHEGVTRDTCDGFAYITCSGSFTDTPTTGQSDVPKPKKCLPCKPVPAGRFGYTYDTSHTHYGIVGGHTHHFRMNQTPPSGNCRCFWQRDFKHPTPGFSPLPGAVRVLGTPTGGGIEP